MRLRETHLPPPTPTLPLLPIQWAPYLRYSNGWTLAGGGGRATLVAAPAAWPAGRARAPRPLPQGVVFAVLVLIALLNAVSV